VEGRIEVNGVVVTNLGFKADPRRDRIKVAGKPIAPFKPRVYLILNKPKGCVTTLNDPLGRPTIRDFLPGKNRRVNPVGRLDFDSEGLLILTNDGELHQRLTHPRYGVPRTYLVKVKGIPDPGAIERMRGGVVLRDGTTLRAKVRLFRRLKRNSWVKITVYEGRNRLIKSMCDAISHPVIRLRRIGYASLTLGELKPGKYRYLTSKEVDELRVKRSPLHRRI
jgi:pseudouridine synthase